MRRIIPIPQVDVMERRVKSPVQDNTLACDECGTSLYNQAFYAIGVGMREVTLCLPCAIWYHDDAHAQGKHIDSVLLENF